MQTKIWTTAFFVTCRIVKRVLEKGGPPRSQTNMLNQLARIVSHTKRLSINEKHIGS